MPKSRAVAALLTRRCPTYNMGPHGVHSVTSTVSGTNRIQHDSISPLTSSPRTTRSSLRTSPLTQRGSLAPLVPPRVIEYEPIASSLAVTVIPDSKPLGLIQHSGCFEEPIDAQKDIVTITLLLLTMFPGFPLFSKLRMRWHHLR